MSVLLLRLADGTPNETLLAYQLAFNIAESEQQKFILDLSAERSAASTLSSKRAIGARFVARRERRALELTREQKDGCLFPPPKTDATTGKHTYETGVSFVRAKRS